jgi:hypothetical protein
MNYFKPSMLDDEDLLKGLGHKNPPAGEIDNSPSLVGQIAQAALTAGATAIGGSAGAAVAKGINENYNNSLKMPAAGATPQQQMAAGPMSYLQKGPLADTSTMTAGYDTGDTRAIYDKDGNLVKQPYGGAVIGNKWNIPSQFPVPFMDFVGKNTG